jgi:hypothetical protein
MKITNRLTRRQFIGAAAAVAAPTIVPASVFGKPGRPAPADRINVALIGCGGQGNSDMNGFKNLPEVQITALCDVDSANLERTKKGVEDFYAKKKDAEFKGVFATRDYREVCSRKDVDAVIVATPDHWHYLTAVEAIRNKKDVYGEKPITHVYGEAKQLVEEVKKHERIWQTGSQQRSEFTFHRGAEIVRNGKALRVPSIEVGCVVTEGRVAVIRNDRIVSVITAGHKYTDQRSVIARDRTLRLVTYVLRPFRPQLVLDRAFLRGILKFGVPFQLNYVVGFLNSAITPLYAGSKLGAQALGLGDSAGAIRRQPRHLLVRK